MGHVVQVSTHPNDHDVTAFLRAADSATLAGLLQDAVSRKSPMTHDRAAAIARLRTELARRAKKGS
jgi:hypothetical protein